MPTILYALKNASMPSFIKIGKTQNLKERIGNLNTAVPYPFICISAVEVSDEDEKKYERLLHSTFDAHRVTTRREFFEVRPDSVIDAMKMIPGRDVTPREDENDPAEKEERESAAQYERKMMRAPFNFKLAEISPNEQVTFVKTDSEDKEITATVKDHKNIQLNSGQYSGEQYSLSKITGILMQDMGYGWSAYAGPDYWKYEGEVLSARRRRLEEEESSDGG